MKKKTGQQTIQVYWITTGRLFFLPDVGIFQDDSGEIDVA